MPGTSPSGGRPQQRNSRELKEVQERLLLIREEEIPEVLTCLTKDERAFFIRRYSLCDGKERDLAAVAEEFGLAPQKARELESTILEKLLRAKSEKAR